MITLGPVRSAIRRASDAASWQQWLLILIALVAAMGMRYALLSNYTLDFTGFGHPWIQTIRHGGFKSLGGSFSNYNPPYLYLLYIGTLLPGLGDLAIIKIIAYLFDLALAAGVATLVFLLHRRVLLAALVGTATLFIPEVLLNSSLWGQADSTYTAFLVWAMVFMVRRKDVASWILFALALSFKLQAGFFLPAMAVAFIVQRHRWRAVLFAGVTLGLTYVPSLLAGRSIASLARIYLTQASHGNTNLTWGAANLYEWISERLYTTVSRGGLFFAIGVVALLSASYLSVGRRLRRPEPWLLQVAAAMGVVVPFIMPGMHERYFYAGAVFAIACIFVDLSYIIPALILQFTAICAYAPFLLRVTIVPLPILAAIQLVPVAWILGASIFRARLTPAPLLSHPERLALSRHARTDGNPHSRTIRAGAEDAIEQPM
jgi:Gpi18-like mannosyltransferase